jgi:hypothetical protein
MKSHFAGRDFGNGKTKKKRRIKKERIGQIHIGKSHFADEERLRGKDKFIVKYDGERLYIFFSYFRMIIRLNFYYDKNF